MSIQDPHSRRAEWELVGNEKRKEEKEEGDGGKEKSNSFHQIPTTVYFRNKLRSIEMEVNLFWETILGIQAIHADL